MGVHSAQLRPREMYAHTTHMHSHVHGCAHTSRVRSHGHECAHTTHVHPYGHECAHTSRIRSHDRYQNTHLPAAVSPVSSAAPAPGATTTPAGVPVIKREAIHHGPPATRAPTTAATALAKAIAVLAESASASLGSVIESSPPS